MPALHLPIARPCHEDWDAMDPGDRGRFCQSCAKSVHDLATMTESEAHAVLDAHAGQRICVRYNVDRQGQIRFRPEAAGRVALAGLALAACTPHDAPARVNAHNLPTIEHVARPIAAVEPDTVPVMGEPPMIERHHEVKMGDIAAPLPPVQHVKGEISVPNEPCDAPAVKGSGKLDDLPRFNDGMR